MFLSRGFAMCALVASLTSAFAAADEACEAFVIDAVHIAFNQGDNQSPKDALSSIQSAVESNVDNERLARFTLGRFARTVDESQLDLYRTALMEYLSAVLFGYLEQAEQVSVEVSKSVDRSAGDCVAETIIRQAGEDDQHLLWRVLGEPGRQSIVDVAPNQDGNTIWLSLELRAQFADLLDRNNGQVDVLISELKSRQPRP